MIQTTQNWKDFSIDHSNYHPLIVVIKNGNIIWTFDATNIKEGSLKFTDDITDLGDFNIGATPSNSFECDIINFDNTFPSPSVFKGCRANLYFFLGNQPEFGGTNAVVGQAIVGQAIVGTESTWTDYIKRGVYYLDPVNSVGRTVHLSGSDAMSLPEFNSANMSGFSFGGLTCYQAIKKMGFNLQHTFPNSDYVLPNVVCNEESNLANITKRTALGYIASLCGCYAHHDNTGELRLSRFALSTPTTVTKIMQEPNLNYYPVTVTGVFVSGTEGSYSVKGSDGYYLFVENNPFITSPSIADEVATAINTAYNGLSIYPFSLSYIADPSLQAGDTIDITYNGNTTTTIVGSLQYFLGNQSTLSIDADTEEHSSAEALIASIPGTKLAIQDLYKGDVLKKIINLSADEVQIDADNLNINGVVSANNNFKINLDGTVEAVNGVFSGIVNATSGTFSGSLNSTSGTIGGFSIESSNLHNGMTSLSDTTNNGVYVGTDGIALGKGNFKVTSAGALTATGATFTNGTINCGSNFSVDTSGNVTAHSLTSDNATITGGSIDITTTTASNDKIYLRFNNGSLQNSIAISPSGLGVSESGTYGSFNTAVNARGITVSNPSVGTGGTTYASILRPTTGNGVQMILCDYNGAERMVFDGANTLGKLSFKNSGSVTASVTPSSGDITCTSLHVNGSITCTGSNVANLSYTVVSTF